MTQTKTVYYYWVGNRLGYIFSTEKDNPSKGRERLKYMGFSSDLGWPKLMNTGRLLHKPSGKARNKNKKQRKYFSTYQDNLKTLSQACKTDTGTNQQ